MKKILIGLMLVVSTFLFGSENKKTEKLDYIIKIEKVEYEDNEYQALVKFEQALSDDGTLGLNFVRMSRALKHMQEQHPDANWLYCEVVDDKNETVLNSSIKKGKVNLINKDNNVDICREVLENGNVLLIPELRQKMKKFIQKGEIPLI